MGSIDEVTWQVLTVLLTVLGLVASGVLWRRRGAATGLRGVAWSLLPVAALLTGTWRLIWEIGDAVVSWAVRFVFSPVVWLGVGVATVSAALFLVTAAMRRRGVGADDHALGSRTGTSRRSTKTTDPALASRSDHPVAKAPVEDDLAEIEAILKQRGIS